MYPMRRADTRKEPMDEPAGATGKSLLEKLTASISSSSAPRANKQGFHSSGIWSIQRYLPVITIS